MYGVLGGVLVWGRVLRDCGIRIVLEGRYIGMRLFRVIELLDRVLI